ncbi:MAG: sulfatase, partial [Anaerohalosphaera sp.]|nr:sulfatase [Anaerohalosphaera sp.]
KMDRRMFLRGSAAVGLGAIISGCTGGLTGGSGLEGKRPNILMCVADDASYPHMGAYGCDWVNTPGFDRVAGEGILFNRAYTPNAKCAPSRACIITGRNSWQLEAAANHWCNFPAKFKTYAEALGDGGYFVGYTTKGWAPGNPGKVDGVRRLLLGKAYNAKKLEPPTRGISKTDYASNFEDFLNDRSDDKPFCFWYGSVEPHRGYEYGSGIAKGGKKIDEVDRVPKYWPDNDVVRTDMLDYAFEIDYFDKHLQRMLKLLEQRGELDNTIVVVTADNGMPFPRVKGQEYEHSNHLPLAIMWKDGIKSGGRKVDDFVSFIDFAPTFLETAGISEKASGMEKIEGRSLVGIFRSSKSGIVEKGRDHVLIGKERHDVGRPHDWGYPIRGIVKGEYLYVRNFETDRWPAGNPETGYLNTDGGATKTDILNKRRSGEDSSYWKLAFGKRGDEELYRIDKDPDCVENLAGDANFAKVKKQLNRQLVSELKKQGDPRMFGKGHVFDEYDYVDRNSKGFYERYMKGEKLNSGWVSKSDFEPAGSK